MNAVSQLEPESLRALFWRDEIPEAMHWLRREGFGEKVDHELLERFLWSDVNLDRACLDSLVGDGLLRRAAAGRYELTDAGRSHGAGLFADDFPDRFVASGPCGCWGPAPEAEPGTGACACGCCGPEPEAQSAHDCPRTIR